MGEPTLSLSTYDLILDVALAADVAYYGSDGQQRAMPPVNEHDLEKCLRCVNRGIEMFIAAAPPNGWRWMNRIAEVTLGIVETTGTVDSGDATSLIDATLYSTYATDDEIVGYYVYDLTKEIYAAITAYTAATGDITVAAWLDYDDKVSTSTPAAGDSFSITDVKTVEGDKARYPLDQAFQGDVAGRITYAKNSNRGHIIDWAHETTIRLKREVSVGTGNITRAAVRPWRNRRWELIVDPSPTAADTLIFPYRIGFSKLQLVTGVSDAGGATYITDADRFEPADFFNTWICTVIDSTGRGSYAEVSDYDSRGGTATCTDGTGKIAVASTAHGLSTGDIVTISGTTDYNGTAVATKVDGDNFTVPGTYTTNQTGTWVQRQIEVADWLTSGGSAGGVDPSSSCGYYVEPQVNRHPAGWQFDDAIRAAVLAATEREFNDVNEGYMGEFLDRALPKAYELDARSAPRKLGMMLPGNRPFRHRRTWKDVTYS